MSDEKSWVDRLFGQGMVFSFAGAVVGFSGLYLAYVKSSTEQEKLRGEVKTLLDEANKNMKKVQERMEEVEKAVAIAKAEAHGAALQASLAQIQVRYQPDDQLLLRGIGTQFTDQQKKWVAALNQTSTPPPPPPPPPKFNLDFLKKSDQTSIDSILKNTDKAWTPPSSFTLPKLSYQPPLHVPLEDKSFWTKAWETAKAYPAIVILLLIIVAGAAFKK